MFVVKVGKYYIKDVKVEFGGYIDEIILSKEIMRNFSQEGAKRMAEMTNGEVINMADIDTFTEED